LKIGRKLSKLWLFKKYTIKHNVMSERASCRPPLSVDETSSLYCGYLWIYIERHYTDQWRGAAANLHLKGPTQ